jgi:hypothetical protein
LATPVAAFFNFGTSDVLLNPDGSVLYCPGGLCLPSEAISFAFVGGFPNSNGMYSPNAFALDGNDPVGYFENGSASLAIISTPEPSSGSLVFWGLLALLSLSFARMHLFKRRSHRNPSVACFD